MVESKDALVYVVCPHCKTQRKKGEDKKWNIVRRGYERNKLARFLCKNCNNWFNEKTGEAMGWYGR